MPIDLQPALIGAFSAGVLGLIASIVRGAMFNRSEHNVRRHESRSGFLQAQISELYSPLLGHLGEILSYYEVLRDKLAELDLRAITGEPGEAYSDEQRQALCRRFAELYFEPRYHQIAQLLRQRRHLITEDEFPQYMAELLSLAVGVEATRAVAHELGEDADPCLEEDVQAVRAAIPQVEATLLVLRAQYRKHLRALGRLHWGRS